MFPKDEQELGYATGDEYEIHWKTDAPIRLPYRHIPLKCVIEVKAHNEGLREQGVIEVIVSSYAAPVVLDNSPRLCATIEC